RRRHRSRRTGSPHSSRWTCRPGNGRPSPRTFLSLLALLTPFSDWRRGAFAGRRSPTLGRQNVKRSIPPVTVSTAPVMYRARSEHRNATAFATSSGSPSRCIATRLTIRSYSGLSLALGAMIPGAIALHVTLYRAPSRATDFANPIRPILLVEYAV